MHPIVAQRPDQVSTSVLLPINSSVPHGLNSRLPLGAFGWYPKGALGMMGILLTIQMRRRTQRELETNMSDVDIGNGCLNKSEIPGFEKNFVEDGDSPAVADNAQCWYAACARGETGGKTTNREAARQAAIRHQQQTGHNSGVMGPVPC